MGNNIHMQNDEQIINIRKDDDINDDTILYVF